MCTAISYLASAHFFGRNLDLEYSYNEKVVITPRYYPLRFKEFPHKRNHFAMIGMAAVADNYPLYYDATNEFGLSMAGLNFPGNAAYYPYKPGKYNISPFELIPWILCQCKTVTEASGYLNKLNLLDVPFSPELELSPLHWILSDKEESLTIESTKQGLQIYNNPIGILTNNPSFDYHLTNLCNYRNLTNLETDNSFSEKVHLDAYSRGMGAIGLPGDNSSTSRFVRAAFNKLNSVPEECTNGEVSQFFHLLDSVAMIRGCLIINGLYDKTLYSSCCDTAKGIYYYTTYNNRQITGINMHHELLDSDCLITFPLNTSEEIKMVN